jgi:hypothetical protein
MFNRTLIIVISICLISCTKEIIQQKLTVSVTPANGGSVSPPSNSYEKGSNVSLVATPTGEYLFKQWQGSISGMSNPTSITMDDDKSVTGVFEKRQYPLTLTIEGNGTVKEEVIAIATQALYPSGTTVRLTAQPADKFEFGGWSGDLTSTTNPIDLKIEKAISLKALFQQIKFPGYKVNKPLLLKNEIEYWRDCGVMWDVIMHKYNVLPNGQILSNFAAQAIPGDFNGDGFIDVFNPGTGSARGVPVDYCQWIIWNPVLKTFENKKLLNDKSIKYFGGGQNRSISYDINKDGYTDVVVLDSGDDAMNYDGPRPLQPIRMVLSDGKGGYDLKELNNITPNYMYNHSGDIGDLNNDGNLDLVVATGTTVYISWGISVFPYFSNKVSYFSVDYFNPNLVSDNGFGESVPEAAGGVRQITIADINKDGWNDIIEGGSEQSAKVDKYLLFDQKHRILLNQGKGRFNQKGIVQLPFYFDDLSKKNGYFTNHDFRVIDYNNDGLNDIISTSSIEYDNYGFLIYIQNIDGTYKIEKSKFVFNINSNRRVKGTTPGYWKPWLVLYDFNNDGLKDISYIDNTNFDAELKTKTVFIRIGDNYVEQDYYQFDDFAKSIKP